MFLVSWLNGGLPPNRPNNARSGRTWSYLLLRPGTGSLVQPTFQSGRPARHAVKTCLAASSKRRFGSTDANTKKAATSRSSQTIQVTAAATPDRLRANTISPPNTTTNARNFRNLRRRGGTTGPAFVFANCGQA